MPSFVELATQIVAAQASSTAMSTEEILSSLTRIHSTMGQLEIGAAPEIAKAAAAPAPALSVKEAFRKNEVICLICGKSFQKLSGHLSITHGMKQHEYRKQFGIPRTQPLCSKVVHERAKQLVEKLGLPKRDGTGRKSFQDLGGTGVPEANPAVAEATSGVAEAKRGPGRPKGSKTRSQKVQKSAHEEAQKRAAKARAPKTAVTTVTEQTPAAV